MPSEYTVLERKTVFNGRVFTIFRDVVKHSSGYQSVREVVSHDGGAVAVAVFENRDVVLIRQFRYPMQKEILELPAGKLGPGEDPELCAARELQEETGFSANRFEKLTSMMTTPGFCSEVLHIYLATGLREGTRALEQGEESITTVKMPLKEAINRCLSGEINDSKTVTGLMLAGLKTGVLAQQNGNGNQ